MAKAIENGHLVPWIVSSLIFSHDKWGSFHGFSRVLAIFSWIFRNFPEKNDNFYMKHEGFPMDFHGKTAISSVDVP